jgi:NADH:ubiquinone oxidoreductase subunit E
VEPIEQYKVEGTCACASMEDPRFAELDKTIEKYGGSPSGLIQVLHKAQSLFGYLPEDVQLYVARSLNLPMSKVFGVSTFYAFFTLQPVGRHRIQVCMGTACYVKGAAALVERLESDLGIQVGGTTKDQRFSLEVARCVGACGLSPVMMIDGEVYAKLKPEELPDILAKYE